jgi:hypothetical protein
LFINILNNIFNFLIIIFNINTLKIYSSVFRIWWKDIERVIIKELRIRLFAEKYFFFLESEFRESELFSDVW